MSDFLQTVILGVFQGSLDALLAMGVVLIFRTSGVLNFALAATGTIGAYVMYWPLQGRPLAALWLMVPAGLIVGGLCGVASFSAIRGLRARHYALTVAVATLAVAVLITQVVAQIINIGGYSSAGQFPDPFGGGAISSGGVVIQYYFIAAIAVALGLALGIGGFLRYTRAGTMIRALADDPQAARLCGGNVPLLLAAVWFLSGVLAAVAGFFDALISFNPSFLDPFFVAALIAAVLGGLRSLVGAFAGGVALEIGRNLWEVYGPADYRQYALSVLLAVLILVLIVAPRRWLAPASRRLV